MEIKDSNTYIRPIRPPRPRCRQALVFHAPNLE